MVASNRPCLQEVVGLSSVFGVLSPPGCQDERP